jgi:hypothetical protein
LEALTRSSERQDSDGETRDGIQMTSETGDLIKLEFFPQSKNKSGRGTAIQAQVAGRGM